MSHAARPSGVGGRGLAIWVAFWLMLLQGVAHAQNFDFKPPGGVNDPGAPAVLRDLANRVLPVYEENQHERYLANLSAMQMIGGDYTSAASTRDTLRERRNAAGLGVVDGSAVLYDIYDQAKALEQQSHMPFAQSFAQVYRDTLSHLNGPDAQAVTAFHGPAVDTLQQNMQRTFDQMRGKDSIALPDAINMLWEYYAFDSYRNFEPLLYALGIEDEQRRYETDELVSIRTPAGTSLYATIVRPRNVGQTLPALLEFTLSEDASADARAAAAHGYVGIVAYGRGSHHLNGRVVPYEFDSVDAAAVVNWIAKQTWSDGRVGMYGNDYAAFSAWAATRRMPKPLKAIAVSASIAPGIDFPMTGSIFESQGYRWAEEVAPGHTRDPAEEDDAHWRDLNQAWYRSGQAYQELDDAFGVPNRYFHRWLGHPSYDNFWQSMIPFQRQFAHITIPVLATTGYFDRNQSGVLYYLSQMQQFNSHADHTLLVGPYDHDAMLRVSNGALGGYTVDAGAAINLPALRFQWFDSIFKGGMRPPLLKDKVNYQLMGANEWHHVASVNAMANGTSKLFLAPGGDTQVLTAHAADANAYVDQTVQLSDRSDADWQPPGVVVSRTVPTHNSVVYVGEPLQHAMDVAGQLSGTLDFSLNKQDVDLDIGLYVQMPNGEYWQLYAPSYEFRASYAHDRTHRRLLRAGERQQLPFRAERLIGCRLPVGSRVVLTVSVVKRADQEINYGTGDNVSEDTLADNPDPVQIRWYAGSFIQLPTAR